MNLISPIHQPHHDVSQLLDADLLLWTEETQIIEKETGLFVNLLAARLHELSKSRAVNFSPLFDEIAHFEKANPEFQDRISGYLVKLEGIKECEDLQCETYFLEEHIQFKRNVETHMTRYRQLKKQLLDSLQRPI